jgi:hypothetical protein
MSGLHHLSDHWQMRPGRSLEGRCSPRPVGRLKAKLVVERIRGPDFANKIIASLRQVGVDAAGTGRLSTLVT